MKRKAKSELNKLRDKVWELCREIKSIMEVKNCYTCDAKNISGANCHLGHGKPFGALPVKYQYDLRNLHWQCMRCNKWLGGMQDIFIGKMEKDKQGLAFLKEACFKEGNLWKIKRKESLKAIDFLTEYKEVLEKKKEKLSTVLTYEHLILE